MYKLLVVDDEFNIRNGLCNSIPWDSCGVKVVGTATNGLDGLEKFRGLRPDIVITDIYMDKMSGLELAEKIKAEAGEVKVIIISGYDDFEYAKKAIDIKVFSYVLKPILPNNIMEVVKSAITELEQERKLQERVTGMEQELAANSLMLKQRFYEDLVEGRIDNGSSLESRAEFLGISFTAASYMYAVFDTDGYCDLSPDPATVYPDKLQLSLKSIIEEILSRTYKLHTILRAPHKVAVILELRSYTDKRFRDAFYEQLEKIREAVKKILGMTITVGLGNICDSPLGLSNSCREAETAMEYRAVIGRDSIIHIDDAAALGGKKYIYPAERERQILESIGEGDIKKLKPAIEAFFKDISRQSGPRYQMDAIIVQLFASVARKFSEAGSDIYTVIDPNTANPYNVLKRFNSLEQVENWITNLSAGAMEMLETQRKNELTAVVKKAQEFILQNYYKPDISLNLISDYLSRSPAYFSKIYKEQTGETYVEFITRVRMEEAKRLLRSSAIRIADVGEKVGYSNSQYFCTLFKKFTGLTPLEYRESKDVAR